MYIGMVVYNFLVVLNAGRTSFTATTIGSRVRHVQARMLPVGAMMGFWILEIWKSRNLEIRGAMGGGGKVGDDAAKLARLAANTESRREVENVKCQVSSCDDDGGLTGTGIRCFVWRKL